MWFDVWLCWCDLVGLWFVGMIVLVMVLIFVLIGWFG